MKLTFNEINFVKNAIESATIKAVDAPEVGVLVTKIHKEADRLQKLESNKAH